MVAKCQAIPRKSNQAIPRKSKGGNQLNPHPHLQFTTLDKQQSGGDEITQGSYLQQEIPFLFDEPAERKGQEDLEARFERRDGIAEPIMG